MVPYFCFTACELPQWSGVRTPFTEGWLAPSPRQTSHRLQQQGFRTQTDFCILRGIHGQSDKFITFFVVEMKADVILSLFEELVLLYIYYVFVCLSVCLLFSYRQSHCKFRVCFSAFTTFNIFQVKTLLPCADWLTQIHIHFVWASAYSHQAKVGAKAKKVKRQAKQIKE